MQTGVVFSRSQQDATPLSTGRKRVHEQTARGTACGTRLQAERPRKVIAKVFDHEKGRNLGPARSGAPSQSGQPPTLTKDLCPAHSGAPSQSGRPSTLTKGLCSACKDETSPNQPIRPADRTANSEPSGSQRPAEPGFRAIAQSANHETPACLAAYKTQTVGRTRMNPPDGWFAGCAGSLPDRAPWRAPGRTLLPGRTPAAPRQDPTPRRAPWRARRESRPGAWRREPRSRSPSPGAPWRPWKSRRCCRRPCPYPCRA